MPAHKAPLRVNDAAVRRQVPIAQPPAAQPPGPAHARPVESGGYSTRQVLLAVVATACAVLVVTTPASDFAEPVRRAWADVRRTTDAPSNAELLLMVQELRAGVQAQALELAALREAHERIQADAPTFLFLFTEKQRLVWTNFFCLFCVCVCVYRWVCGCVRVYARPRPMVTVWSAGRLKQ